MLTGIVHDYRMHGIEPYLALFFILPIFIDYLIEKYDDPEDKP